MARSPWLRLLPVVALVLAGALAACGDDDGGTVRDSGGSASGGSAPGSGSGSDSGSGSGSGSAP
jgi:hypothetical protein